MKSLSLNICIKTLRRAAETRWLAVQNEMAVSVLFFGSEKTANRDAKRKLIEVYATAGYQCLTAQDRDYKAIWARVDAGAKLYKKLTHSVIMEWAGEAVSSQMIDAVAAEIAKLNLCTIVDVLEYCSGEKRHPPRMPRARSVEAAGTVHVKTAHLDLSIPPEITYEEIMEAANRLIELARSRQEVLASDNNSETPQT